MDPGAARAEPEGTWMAAASPTRARITIESIAGAAMVVCMEGTIEIYLSTVPTVGQQHRKGGPGGAHAHFLFELEGEGGGGGPGGGKFILSSPA